MLHVAFVFDSEWFGSIRLDWLKKVKMMFNWTCNNRRGDGLTDVPMFHLQIPSKNRILRNCYFHDKIRRLLLLNYFELIWINLNHVLRRLVEQSKGNIQKCGIMVNQFQNSFCGTWGHLRSSKDTPDSQIRFISVIVVDWTRLYKWF